MDYDFSGLCSDQLDKLQKKLDSLEKAFINEYQIALNVINSPLANTNRGQIVYDVETLLKDASKNSKSLYAAAMNKLIEVLKRDL